MGLIKKNKNKGVNQPVYIPEPVKCSVSEEQKAMARSRANLDQLIEQLQKMQQQDFLSKMSEAAYANENLVDQNKAEIEHWINESPAFADKLEERISLEEGLYILPDMLSDYKKRIDLLTDIFKDYTSSGACITGADEIDPLLGYYIKKYGEALSDGQKLKADVVWLVLKYAVRVVHEREPQGKTEEDKRMVLEHRKEIVEKTFGAIVKTVDKIYGDLFNLTKTEELYAKKKDEFDKANEKLKTIPDEYKSIMDTMGFNGVMQKYSGHPIREFLDIAIYAASVLSQVELQDLYKERGLANIRELRSRLDIMIDYVVKSFNEQGMDYDNEEVMREINRISEDTVRKINDMYAQQLEAYEQSQQLSSKVAAAASNQEWATAAEDSRARILARNELEEERANFNRMLEERKAAFQAEKKQQEDESQNNEDNRIMADIE